MLITRTRRSSARNPRRLWPAAVSALGLVLTIALLTASAAFAAPPVAEDVSVTVKQNRLETIFPEFDDPDDGDLVAITGHTHAAHGSVTCDDFSCDYTPDFDYLGPDSFDYTVFDGLDADTATISITVVANQAPAAFDQAVTARKNVPKDILLTFFEPDGDEVTVTVTAGPTHGDVTCEEPGSCVYTPDLDYVGPDSFGYTVSDGTDGDTATVSITVLPNNPPVALDDAFSVQADTPETIFPRSNDTDADLDFLTISGFTDPAHGSVTCDDVDCEYTPNAGFTGQDSFDYTVSDGALGSDTATVFLSVGVLGPPVANDDTLKTKRNLEKTVFPLNNDEDPDFHVLTIESVTDPAHGTVTCGVFADCVYTPDLDYVGPDSFDYVVTDGTGDDTATVNVTVVLNSPPVAVDDSLTTKLNTAKQVFPLLNDTDADEEDDHKITASTPPAHGSITCGFSACTYTPTTGYLGPDNFTYTVSDGTDTDVGTVNVSVVPNSPPEAQDGTLTTEVNTPATFFPSVTDADLDPLSLTGATDPPHGSATCGAGGSFTCTYTPDLNYAGPDSFDYMVTDGEATVSATVTVTVLPSAQDDVVVTPRNTPVDFNVLANDVGLASPTTVTVDEAPAHGNVTCANTGACTYTPAAGFTGGDNFEYTVTFGSSSDTAHVFIRVTAPPTAGPGGPLVLAGIDAEDGGVSGHGPINVYIDLANSILANVENGGSGILVIGGTQVGCDPREFWDAIGAGTGRAVTYVGAAQTPGQSFAGFAMIAVVSSEFQTSCGLTNAENDAFAARRADIEAFVNGGGGLFGTSQDGLTSRYGYLADIGEFTFNTGLSYDDITPTAAGLAAGITDELDICCWHDEYVAFPTWMNVLATNVDEPNNVAALGGTSTVVGNEPPVAINDSITTQENVAKMFDLTAIDPEGAPLTFIVVTQPTNGTVTCSSAGACTYTPNAGYSGPDSFTFKANDGQLDSDVATISITVEPVNDPPNAVDDSLTTPEDAAGMVDVLANDTDPDGDALTVTGSTDGAHGTVSCTAAGMCTYTPAANFNGPDSFTYTISDGRGGVDTATVSVTVTPVNDPPSAVDDTLTTPQNTAGSVNVLANDSDPDGDTLTVTGSTNGTNGTVSCTAGGACTYTPNAGFSGSDSFTYTIADGHGGTDTATVNVTVTGVNAPPNAVDDSLTTPEDTAGTVDVLANDTDPDGDALSVTGSTDGTHGTVSCTAAGMCTYTPPANFNGPDSFTYTISDGHGGVDTATVSVTVTPVNDPPNAVDDSLTTAEDTVGTVDVLANDTDPDGDALSVTGSTNGAHGTVSCTAAGMCTYTPAANFNGPDSFTYTIADGHGGSDTATVSVTVTPVNDPPNAVDDSLTTPEDAAGTVDVLANDSDPDGDALTVTGSTNGAHGTVSCTAAGMCAYTPAANFNGPDSFTYTIADGHGGVDTATVSVTVTPVNDPPNAVDDTLTTPQNTAGSVNVLANDSDPDGDTLTVTGSTNGTNGTVSCTAGGACTYTPNAGFSGSDSFTYTIADGHGGTDTATVNVTVTPAGPMCNGLRATFVGGPGNTYFQGGPGVDVIVDLGGDNYLQTGGGNDHICLGNGKDEIDSGDGNDFVDAGGGQNKVKTGNGADIVRAGIGDDEIDTGNQNDDVVDLGGKNKIVTGDENDLVVSGSGDDEIDTGNGIDVVTDTGGHNIVKTGDGNDVITTGAGNDQIDGGNGFDVCSAGAGRNEVKDCEIST